MLSLVRVEVRDDGLPALCRPLRTAAQYDAMQAEAQRADELPPIAAWTYGGYDQLASLIAPR